MCTATLKMVTLTAYSTGSNVLDKSMGLSFNGLLKPQQAGEKDFLKLSQMFDWLCLPCRCSKLYDESLTQAMSWNWLSDSLAPAEWTMEEDAMAVGSLEYVNIAAASLGLRPWEPCATWTPASWAGLM